MKKVAVLPYTDYEQLERSRQQTLQQQQQQFQQPYFPQRQETNIVQQAQLRQQPHPTMVLQQKQPPVSNTTQHQPLQLQPHQQQQQQQQTMLAQISQSSLGFQQNQPLSLYDPKVEKMISYEKELNRILNSDMNVHEKRVQYQMALQQLLDFKDMHQHAVTPEQDSSHYKHEDSIKQTLEQTLPVKNKKIGFALYNNLKDQILWDEAGQLIIDGETITGSNIIDLINDLSRTWMKPPLTGWEKLKNELQTINFPRSLIQNKQRLRELENIVSSPRPDVTPSGTSFASSRVKNSKLTTVNTRARKIIPSKMPNWISS